MGKVENIQWYCYDSEKKLRKGKKKPLESCILNYSELYIYSSVPYYCGSYEYRKSGMDLQLVVILTN